MRSMRFAWWGLALLLAFAFATSTPLYAQSADLAVTATAPATAAVGSNVVFTVTVLNNGPDPATNVALTDVLPSGATFVSETQNNGPTFACTTPSVGASGGTVSCTIASFLNGDSAQFSITVNVSAAAAGTTLINTASVSSETPDDNSENNTSITGTSVPGGNLADVGVTKTGPAFAAPGSNVTYTITVSNFGPNDATNVSVTDTLGAGLTFVSLNQNSGPSFTCPGSTTPCTIASLPNGATATFQLVATVSSTPGTYNNTANVNSDNDPNSSNDSSVTSVTVASADVGVTKSAPATAIAGGPTFDYIITLSNSGPDAAANAAFSDALPGGVTFVSVTQNTGPSASCVGPPIGTNGTVQCSISALLNGQSAQFTLTVKAAASVTNGTVLTNTATATSSTTDSNSNNNSASANTTVSTNADVSIVKTGPSSVVAGGTASYTLTVANAGPSDAASVSLSDILPPGLTFVSLTQTSGPTFSCTTGSTVTCTRSSLAAGASAAFTLVAAVSASTPAGSSITNTATVASSTTDPTPGNNTSSSSPAIVSAAADLAVIKTANYSGTLGGNIVYTLGITNNGPSAAAAVQLSDALPSGTHFVSLTQPTGPVFNCVTPAVGATGTVNCTIASLAAGANATFVLTVDTIGLAGGTLNNTATATSTTGDPNSANNTASASVVLAVPVPYVPAPTLHWLGLLLLATLLGAFAALQQRRNRLD